MRIHGYCTSCRRIKLVSVSGSEFARMQAARTSVPSGECTACAQKKNCTHARTNERDPQQQAVRCLDCSSWGRRDRRDGKLYWT